MAWQRALDKGRCHRACGICGKPFFATEIAKKRTERRQFTGDTAGFESLLLHVDDEGSDLLALNSPQRQMQIFYPRVEKPGKLLEITTIGIQRVLGVVSLFVQVIKEEGYALFETRPAVQGLFW